MKLEKLKRIIFAVALCGVAACLASGCQGKDEDIVKACSKLSADVREADPCCNDNYRCTNVTEREHTEVFNVALEDQAHSQIAIDYVPVHYIYKVKASDKDKSALAGATAKSLYREARLAVESDDEGDRALQTVCINKVTDNVTDFELPKSSSDAALAYVVSRGERGANLYGLNQEGMMDVQVEYKPVPGSNTKRADLKCVGSDIGASLLVKGVKSWGLMDGSANAVTPFVGTALSHDGDFIVWSGSALRPITILGDISDYVYAPIVVPGALGQLAVLQGSFDYYLLSLNATLNSERDMFGYRTTGGDAMSMARMRFGAGNFTRPKSAS
jgi:hypothetical protein